jgi:hypothetical protein
LSVWTIIVSPAGALERATSNTGLLRVAVRTQQALLDFAAGPLAGPNAHLPGEQRIHRGHAQAHHRKMSRSHIHHQPRLLHPFRSLQNSRRHHRRRRRWHGFLKQPHAGDGDGRRAGIVQRHPQSTHRRLERPEVEKRPAGPALPEDGLAGDDFGEPPVVAGGFDRHRLQEIRRGRVEADRQHPRGVRHLEFDSCLQGIDLDPWRRHDLNQPRAGTRAFDQVRHLVPAGVGQP